MVQNPKEGDKCLLIEKEPRGVEVYEDGKGLREKRKQKGPEKVEEKSVSEGKASRIEERDDSRN